MSNDPRSKFQAGVADAPDLETMHRFARHEAKLKQQAAAEPAVAAVPQPEVDTSRMNVFERRKLAQQASARTKTAPVADSKRDEMNKFQLHDEAVKERRRDTSAVEKRIEKKQKNKATWQRQQQPAATAAGGTVLPADLAALKRASDKDRVKRRQPPRVIDTEVLAANVVYWRLNYEHGRKFVDGIFNGASLSNAIQTLLGEGDENTPAMIDRAYVRAIEGNHLFMFKTGEYAENGAIVRPRGMESTPPTLFPKHIWADEAQSIAEDEMRKSIERTAKEREWLLSMNFADLQKLAQKSFKAVDSTSAGIGGIR
jgi:hypothetical protein